MAINWTNDLGAPLAVTAIDLTIEATRPEWNEWASYLTAGLGYAAAIGMWRGLGIVGGDFLKNMGIAAMPWAAKNIYERVRGGMTSPVRRLSMQKVSRWPAPLVEEPFGGARMV